MVTVIHEPYCETVAYLVAYRCRNLSHGVADCRGRTRIRARSVRDGGVAYGGRTRNRWSHNPALYVRG